MVTLPAMIWSFFVRKSENLRPNKLTVLADALKLS